MNQEVARNPDRAENQQSSSLGLKPAQNEPLEGLQPSAGFAGSVKEPARGCTREDLGAELYLAPRRKE